MKKYRCIQSFSIEFGRTFYGGEIISEPAYLYLPSKYQVYFVEEIESV